MMEEDLVEVAQEIDLRCPYTMAKFVEPVISAFCSSKHPWKAMEKKAFETFRQKTPQRILCPHCRQNIAKEELLSQDQMKEIVSMVDEEKESVYLINGQIFLEAEGVNKLNLSSRFQPRAPPPEVFETEVDTNGVKKVIGRKGGFFFLKRNRKVNAQMLLKLAMTGEMIENFINHQNMMISSGLGTTDDVDLNVTLKEFWTGVRERFHVRFGSPT